MCSPVTSEYQKIYSKYTDENIEVNLDQVTEDEVRKSNPEEFRLQLIDRNFLDEKGCLKQQLNKMCPLGHDEIWILDRLLKTSHHFKGINNFNVILEPYELIFEIYSVFWRYIEDILIVGGTVNQCLTKQFINRNLKKIRFKECVPDESIEFLTQPTKDLDIRIKLKPTIKEPIELYASIQNRICMFLAKKYFLNGNPSIEESKFVWLNAFVKKKSKATDFSIFSLENELGWRFEIFISHCFEKINLEEKLSNRLVLREFLFLSDALSISIIQFCNTLHPKQIYLKTYVDNGWTSLFAKITNVIGSIEINTMDEKAFPSYLAKIIKGNTDPYLEFSDLHVKRFCEIKPKISAESLFFYFEHAFNNHLDITYNHFYDNSIDFKREQLVNGLFLGISFAKELYGKIEHNIYREFVRKIYDHIIKLNQNGPLDPFVEYILYSLIDENISIDLFYHIFSVKSLCTYILKSSISNLTISKKIHARHVVLQLKYHNSFLILPFDPLKSLQMIHDNRHIFFKSAPSMSLFSFVNQFQNTNVKEEFVEISNCFLEYAKSFLKDKTTAKCGYDLLILYLLLNPKDISFLLFELPNIITLFGIQELEKIKNILLENKDVTIFLNTLTNNLADEDLSNFLLKYIELLLTHELFRYVGWQVYESISVSEQKKQKLTKHLFHRIKLKDLAVAKILYNKLKLNNLQNIFYLLDLRQCAIQLEEPFDINQIINPVVKCIKSEMTPKEIGLWLKVCSVLCRASFFEESYSLWKEGAIQAQKLQHEYTKFYKKYQKFLLELLSLFNSFCLGSINAVEILLMLGRHGTGDLFDEKMVNTLYLLAEKKPLCALHCLSEINQTDILRKDIHLIYEISFKNLDDNFKSQELPKILLKLLFLEFSYNENVLTLKHLLLIFLNVFIKIKDENTSIEFNADVSHFFKKYLKICLLLPMKTGETINLFKLLNHLPFLNYSEEDQKLSCDIFNQMLQQNISMMCIQKLALEGPLRHPCNLSEVVNFQKAMITYFLNLNEISTQNDYFYRWLELSIHIFKKNELNKFCNYFIQFSRFDLAINFLKLIDCTRNIKLKKTSFYLFRILVFTQNLILEESTFFLKILNREIIENFIYHKIKHFKKKSQFNECLIFFKKYDIANIVLWKRLIEKEISFISSNFDFLTPRDKQIYVGNLKSVTSFIHLICKKKIEGENHLCAVFFYNVIKYCSFSYEMVNYLTKNSKLILEEIIVNLSYYEKIEVMKPLLASYINNPKNHEKELNDIYEILIERIARENVEATIYESIINIWLLIDKPIYYKKCCASLSKYLWFEDKLSYSIVDLIDTFAASLLNSKHLNSLRKDKTFKLQLYKLIEILPLSTEGFFLQNLMELASYLKDKEILMISIDYIMKNFNEYNSIKNAFNQSRERKINFLKHLDLMKSQLLKYNHVVEVKKVLFDLNSIPNSNDSIKIVSKQMLYIVNFIARIPMRIINVSWNYYKNLNG